VTLVLDSGGVSYLAKRTPQAARVIARLREEGMWPPLVPSAVLVECLTGDAGRDASANSFLKTCDVIEYLPVGTSRRAARARAAARHGSAVDAIVAVTAEPGGTIITGDDADLTALAGQLADVKVVTV
jgi:hypothetical protein